LEGEPAAIVLDDRHNTARKPAMPTVDIEINAAFVRTPFIILIDKAEKAPWGFDGITARSFIDKDQRKYTPRTERRYLGIGNGDYSLNLFQDRIAIERKSPEDFQGTLLGWPQKIEEAEGEELAKLSRKPIDRRGRFKSELRKLQALECRAVVVEASLAECINSVPQWGTRSAEENAKYLYSTFLSWSQQFRVPWYFCDDRRLAEVTAFRIMEQFWDRHRSEYRKRQKTAAQPLLTA
jgi:hypothetical protein